MEPFPWNHFPLGTIFLLLRESQNRPPCCRTLTLREARYAGTGAECVARTIRRLTDPRPFRVAIDQLD